MFANGKRAATAVHDACVEMRNKKRSMYLSPWRAGRTNGVVGKRGSNAGVCAGALPLLLVVGAGVLKSLPRFTSASVARFSPPAPGCGIIDDRVERRVLVGAGTNISGSPAGTAVVRRDDRREVMGSAEAPSVSCIIEAPRLDVVRERLAVPPSVAGSVAVLPRLALRAVDGGGGGIIMTSSNFLSMACFCTAANTPPNSRWNCCIFIARTAYENNTCNRSDGVGATR